MKSHIVFISSMALFIGLAFAQPVDPPKKKTWHGQWHNNKKTSSGRLLWVGEETSECCAIWNINLKASSTDRYGKSTIEGSCAEEECHFEQKYTSGRLKGTTYIYKGTYKINFEKEELISIKGTYSVKGKKPSGHFSFNNFVAR